jgi:pimeloyl-ACP methyl ester carboxylesterase
MTRNCRSWGSVIGPLSARSHVYALDLRGHGESGRVDRAYRYHNFAQDVIEIADKVIRAPAVLIGHSLGALAGLKAAADRPHFARGLVVEDPPVYAYERGLEALQTRLGPVHRIIREGRTASRIAERLVRDTGREAAAARRRANSLAQCDPTLLEQAMDGSMGADWDTDPLLHRIGCPVLLLQADPSRSVALTDEEAMRAQTHLQTCTFRRVDGVNHTIHKESPAAFLGAVEPFLDSLEAGQAEPGRRIRRAARDAAARAVARVRVGLQCAWSDNLRRSEPTRGRNGRAASRRPGKRPLQLRRRGPVRLDPPDCDQTLFRAASPNGIGSGSRPTWPG